MGTSELESSGRELEHQPLREGRGTELSVPVKVAAVAHFEAPLSVFPRDHTLEALTLMVAAALLPMLFP